MKFKNTTEALYIQAKEIVDAVAKIETSGDIHAIELDLLLEKLRSIYDLVSEMKNAISGDSNADVSESLKTGMNENLDTESEIETIPSEEKLEKQDKPIEIEEIPESTKKEKPEVAFITDRFKTSKPTLNEEMEGKSKKENLSSQLNLTPINSISGAIGLNEKFELINELFSGDKNSFEGTLEVLNKADSFVEAYNYLNENFDWDMDSMYVQRILELIRRKLIVRRNEQ